MQLLEQEKTAFKQWLLPKLADRSDAEPEVLADYVAELFGNNVSEQHITEQLSEFLGDHAQTFVNEISRGFEQKSWALKPAAEKKKKKKQDGDKAKAKALAQPTEQLPATTPTGPRAAKTAPTSSTGPLKSTLAPGAPAFVPRDQAVAGASAEGPTKSWSKEASIPTGPRADRINGKRESHAPSGKAVNDQQKQSKKRKLHERDMSQSRNSGSEHTAELSASERPHKQVARRGVGNLGRSGPRVNAPAAAPLSANTVPFTPFSGQPQPPVTNFSFLDPNSPFNFLANMSAMMSSMYSGQVFGAQAPNMPNMPNMPKPKCEDYETKGICRMGNLCPCDHGTAVAVPPDPEYDPTKSSLAMPETNGSHGRTLRSQNRERTRAPFSQSGPSRGLDDTVVVEQIPEDHFTKQQVREFFSQFGTIVGVEMQAYKRLAIVKFSDHPAAQRAYDSPKVVFDNRFVKVYWYKPEHLPQGNGMNGTATQATSQTNISQIYNQDEDMEDLEEVRQKQIQAQKEWEEKQKKADEAEARANMLNSQARAKEEAAKRLRERVMELERAKGVEAINQKEQQAPANDLSKLQSEAAGLFANAGSTAPANGGRRGFTNGRGSTFRGGFRGRGRGGTRGGHGGVVRLDNRPRRLAVAGIEVGSAKERALKQHLLNVKGCTGVHPHAERPNTLVVGFDQRYQAEMFLNEAPRIPNISMTDLSWIANNDAAAQQSIEFDEPAELKHDADEETSDGEVEPKTELDLDVADDEDQWL